MRAMWDGLLPCSCVWPRCILGLSLSAFQHRGLEMLALVGFRSRGVLYESSGAVALPVANPNPFWSCSLM